MTITVHHHPEVDVAATRLRIYRTVLAAVVDLDLPAPCGIHIHEHDAHEDPPTFGAATMATVADAVAWGAALGATPRIHGNERADGSWHVGVYMSADTDSHGVPVHLWITASQPCTEDHEHGGDTCATTARQRYTLGGAR